MISMSSDPDMLTVDALRFEARCSALDEVVILSTSITSLMVDPDGLLSEACAGLCRREEVGADPRPETRD